MWSDIALKGYQNDSVDLTASHGLGCCDSCANCAAPRTVNRDSTGPLCKIPVASKARKQVQLGIGWGAGQAGKQSGEIFASLFGCISK